MRMRSSTDDARDTQDASTFLGNSEDCYFALSLAVIILAGVGRHGCSQSVRRWACRSITAWSSGAVLLQPLPLTRICLMEDISMRRSFRCVEEDYRRSWHIQTQKVARQQSRLSSRPRTLNHGRARRVTTRHWQISFGVDKENDITAQTVSSGAVSQ